MTTRLLLITLTLAGIACGPHEPVEEPPLPPLEGPAAIVVTSDYSDSILARVDLSSGMVYDQLAAFPAGDMLVTVEEGDIYLLSRSGEDVVRRYPGGAVDEAPDLEISTGAGSNPHALELCAGKLWISLYNQSELIALDPMSGERLHTVDLHSYDEGTDNSSEPSSMVESDGHLYLALERFDLHTLQADAEGRILRIDCEDGALVDEWSTGPSPRIQQDSSDKHTLLIKEGDFYTVDGGIRTLSLASGEFGDALLGEAELNADLGAVASAGNHLVASSWAFASTPALSSIHCLDRDTSQLSPGQSQWTQNIWHLRTAPNGAVWAALSPSATEPSAEHGILQVNPATCDTSGEELIRFLLPPTHLVFINVDESEAS